MKKGKKVSMRGASHGTQRKEYDMGKMPNWDGKKQAPTSKGKGFGSR